MVLPNIPRCPESLKGIQHYLTIAAEHDGRDPVVSYWCRMYSAQQGLKIDKTSPEAKKLLFFLLEWLEKEKAAQKDNDAIAHEIPAQAYLENYALKLFMHADQQDRAGVFNKNVVKAFYTSGMLYAMLEMFGELTEEVAKNQKYAKWKAAYIHNCLKNGETPVPGPLGGDESHDMGETSGDPPEDLHRPPDFSGGQVAPPPDTGAWPHPAAGSNQPSSSNPPDLVPGRREAPPPSTPSASSQIPFNIPAGSEEQESASGAVTESGVPLTPDMVAKAQKLCKYASSALNYDDVGTAVGNLRKALALLTTGTED